MLAVVVKVVVFGAACAALLAAGAPRPAVVLGVAAVLGAALAGPLTAVAPEAGVRAAEVGPAAPR